MRLGKWSVSMWPVVYCCPFGPYSPDLLLHTHDLELKGPFLLPIKSWGRESQIVVCKAITKRTPVILKAETPKLDPPKKMNKLKIYRTMKYRKRSIQLTYFVTPSPRASALHQGGLN